jgi:photosystem II stability/assembly factor-like uncharacterized protein
MKKYLILLLFLALFINRIEANNWQLIGFEGKSVYCIAVNPVDKNIIYTGIKDEGIYVSQNAGQDWNLAYSNKIPINCISIDRLNTGNIYVGYNDGLIISKSGGNSFYQVVIEKNINVSSIALDETQTKAIIVGTSKGIYKSFDNGESFLKAGLNNFTISCLTIDNAGGKAILYAGTTNAGVFKSANYGTSWTPINKGINNLHIYSILSELKRPSVLFLGTLEENIYRSENGGDSWEILKVNNKLNQGYVFAQAIDNATSNSVIYLTSLSGDVYKIIDANNIKKLSEPINNVFGTCLGIVNIVPSTLFLGTTSGIYKFDE